MTINLLMPSKCMLNTIRDTSDVSELVQNEGKTVRAYNYISGLYAL